VEAWPPFSLFLRASIAALALGRGGSRIVVALQFVQTNSRPGMCWLGLGGTRRGVGDHVLPRLVCVECDEDEGLYVGLLWCAVVDDCRLG
jgi:hypothetical protein